MAEETITAQTPEIDPGMSVMPEGPGLMDVPTVIPELGLAAQALASQVSFAKKTWKDGSGGGTPVTAVELNRLEQGVADLTAAVNGLRDSVSRSMKYTIDSAEKDLDRLVSFGVYSVKSPVNAPSGVTDWANVIVIPTNGSNVYVAQILVTHAGVIYSRGKGGGSWDIWKIIKRDAL